MAKAVRVDVEAEEEIAAGIDWYERERPGLGVEFFEEIDAAIQSLQNPGPECGPVRHVPPELGVRRKLVQRFRHSIVFIEFDTVVRVIAVAHGAREPGYWLRRI
jgi:toxin ParE1/3/4